MTARHPLRLLLVLAASAALSACDKTPLLAPTQSTITLSSAQRILQLNGTAEVSVVVIEQSGQPVQNGTTVRFTTTLGRVDPVEAVTRNGLATTTFFAGDSSGTATVTATSGAAGGGSGSSPSNTIQFTIGGAATDSVVVRASPTAVPSTGGTVDVVATVLASNGRPISGVSISFSTSAGSLSTTSAVSDGNGEAATRLTTGVAATVTAASSGKTGTAQITVRGAPTATLTCQGSGAGGGTCSQVAEAAVIFTVNATASASPISSATLEFGDGSSASLGALTGATTISHAYTSLGTFTPTLRAVDAFGQTFTTSVAVTVTARPPATPVAVSITGAGETATPPATIGNAQRWTFTASVTPAADAANVESYVWDFGDGTGSVTTSGASTSHVYTGGAGVNGRKIVTVRVRTTDGKSASSQIEIIVSGLL